MRKEFLKSFGRKLKEIRTSKNISQEKLAEMLSVSAKTVSYWENGHNPISFCKLPEIAKALDIPIYQLFLFLTEEKKAADKDYIKILQSKTGKEIEELFKIVKQIQMIK